MVLCPTGTILIDVHVLDPNIATVLSTVFATMDILIAGEPLLPATFIAVKAAPKVA